MKNSQVLESTMSVQQWHSFDTVPEPIFPYILSYLNGKDLSCSSTVNRIWKTASDLKLKELMRSCLNFYNKRLKIEDVISSDFRKQDLYRKILLVIGNSLSRNIEDESLLFPLRLEEVVHRPPSSFFPGVSISSSSRVSPISEEEGYLALYKNKERKSLQSILLKLGANPGTRNSSGNTALHEMASLGKVLLCSNRELYDMTFENYFLPKASELINWGGDPNSRNRKGQTPLHIAAREGFIEGVNFFISAGGKIEVRDNEGRTPLMEVLSGNSKTDVKIELVEIFLSQGADPRDLDNEGNTLLHHALGEDTDIIFFCLKMIPETLNQKNRESSTPLNYFISKNERILKQHEKSILCLLEQGADPSIPDSSGTYPLNEILNKGYFLSAGIQIINSVLRNGADINSPDNNGMTPLHALIENDYLRPPHKIDLIEKLLESGADFRVTTVGGLTPFLGSIVVRDAPVQNFFLRNRLVDISQKIENGMTALHLAVKYESPHLDEIIAYGQEVDPDFLDRCDDFGRSAHSYKK